MVVGAACWATCGWVGSSTICHCARPPSCPAVRLLICIYMHTNALCCSAGGCWAFSVFFYIFTVVFVACGAVVNVAHVVYVTFLIPTLQRRTFSTINAHLSYTCINCRAARGKATGQADQARPVANELNYTVLSLFAHVCVCVCVYTQSIAYEALNLTQLLCLCRLCLCLSLCHIL